MKPKSPAHILRVAKTEIFLVSDLVNIRYLTGLRLSAGILLVTKRKYSLFADGRYREAAEKMSEDFVQVHPMGDFAKTMEKIGECGFEAESVTVDRLRNWKRKYKNTKFIQTTGVLQVFRRSKDEEELRHFRRAQRITAEILHRVPHLLRQRPTERRLAWQLEMWARELGADGLAFDPIVAFGTHTSRPHHEPTNRVLQKGHLVQIDVGASYKGYAADQSAVFFTADPTGLQKRVFTAVTEAKEKAISAVRQGVSTHKLCSVARDVLRAYGFDEHFPHALGHGVGLQIHEGVSISDRSPAEKLLKNEIITIEPGVYLPGQFGIRLEEEVIVK